MSPPLLSRKRSNRRRDSHHLPFPIMAPVSIPDGPPKDTTPTQSFQIPSATAPSSPSPSCEHDPSTGDSATRESPQLQAVSAVATEHPNPEAGYRYLPQAQTHDTISNQSQGVGPSAASPAAPPESPSTETGHPQPNPQVDILRVLPHDADMVPQPARLDEEAQQPGPERLRPWCRAPWNCYQTATFMVMVVACIAAVAAVVWAFVHTLIH
jgi:hypothetical protein